MSYKGLLKTESTPLIMNHYEILKLIQSYQTIFTFLVDRGLLTAGRKCDYGRDGVKRETKHERWISLEL